jgi:hypothetical protein
MEGMEGIEGMEGMKVWGICYRELRLYSMEQTQQYLFTFPDNIRLQSEDLERTVEKKGNQKTFDEQVGPGHKKIRNKSHAKKQQDTDEQ